MTFNARPAYMESQTYDARDDRNLIYALVAGRSGVAYFGDLAVAPASAGPGVKVTIAAGDLFVENNLVTRGGMYHCYNDGPVDVTLDAGDGTHDRIDRLYIVFTDPAYGGASVNVAPLVAKGTPAASPAVPPAPSFGAGTVGYELARITVRAGKVSPPAAADVQSTRALVHDSTGRVVAQLKAKTHGATVTSARTVDQQTFWVDLGRKYLVYYEAEWHATGAMPTRAHCALRYEKGSTPIVPTSPGLVGRMVDTHHAGAIHAFTLSEMVTFDGGSYSGPATVGAVWQRVRGGTVVPDANDLDSGQVGPRHNRILRVSEAGPA